MRPNTATRRHPTAKCKKPKFIIFFKRDFLLRAPKRAYTCYRVAPHRRPQGLPKYRRGGGGRNAPAGHATANSGDSQCGVGRPKPPARRAGAGVAVAPGDTPRGGRAVGDNSRRLNIFSRASGAEVGRQSRPRRAAIPPSRPQGQKRPQGRPRHPAAPAASGAGVPRPRGRLYKATCFQRLRWGTPPERPVAPTH